jgi:hypothetical protein
MSRFRIAPQQRLEKMRKRQASSAASIHDLDAARLPPLTGYEKNLADSNEVA